MGFEPTTSCYPQILEGKHSIQAELQAHNKKAIIKLFKSFQKIYNLFVPRLYSDEKDLNKDTKRSKNKLKCIYG